MNRAKIVLESDNLFFFLSDELDEESDEDGGRKVGDNNGVEDLHELSNK